MPLFTKPKSELPKAGPEVVEVDQVLYARRGEQSWRRAFYGAMIFALLALVILYQSVTHDKREAVTYVQDPNGSVALAGIAGADHSVPDRAVAHQLQLWIIDVRTIVNDVDLINANFRDATNMMAKDSLAFADITNFVRDQNPIAFGRDGYTRTVTDVHVTKITDLTYNVTWTEKLRKDGGAPSTIPESGSVQLAGKPAFPTDPLIGQANPAGVFISSIDMRWTLLTK